MLKMKHSSTLFGFVQKMRVQKLRSSGCICGPGRSSKVREAYRNKCVQFASKTKGLVTSYDQQDKTRTAKTATTMSI